MAYHVGSKLLQAAVFSSKTSNGVVRHSSDSITKWVARISRERLVLESPNFAWHPCRRSLEPREYDDVSYAGRHSWKFEKTIQNAASYCFGVTFFCSSAFCLQCQLVGFLSNLDWHKPNNDVSFWLPFQGNLISIWIWITDLSIKPWARASKVLWHIVPYKVYYYYYSSAGPKDDDKEEAGKEPRTDYYYHFITVCSQLNNYESI